jgi:hypothetical protein
LQVEPEEGAETADTGQDIAVQGFLGEKLDAFLGPVAGRDINASVGVRHGVRLRLVRHE